MECPKGSICLGRADLHQNTQQKLLIYGVGLGDGIAQIGNRFRVEYLDGLFQHRLMKNTLPSSRSGEALESSDELWESGGVVGLADRTEQSLLGLPIQTLKAKMGALLCREASGKPNLGGKLVCEAFQEQPGTLFDTGPGIVEGFEERGF